MPTTQLLGREIPYEIWDISQTIPELAYLTHNLFRYYGKFPSVLARDLIEQFAIPGTVVLDNYVGCGTTLVEAKLASYNSIGVDINPLGVLASKVKTRVYDLEKLRERWKQLQDAVSEHYQFFYTAHDLFGPTSRYIYDQSLQLAKANQPPNFPDIDKWFVEKNKLDLGILKHCILSLEPDEYREFFVLAFVAIIRRVSCAYDGEIRPHVNKKKATRRVWKAYAKKVKEMIQRMEEFVHVASNDAWAVAELEDNRNLSRIPVVQQNPIGMIVSHPPYLNSFDYLPAFKLQLLWSQGFPEIWRNYDLESIRNLEVRAWPATNEQIFESYFENHRLIYRQAYEVLEPNGVCCVVIGDATIRKRLIPVHKMIAEICESVGFTLERVIYRTTHYGVGKYAYNFRADYHEDASGKKDGVLILRK